VGSAAAPSNIKRSSSRPVNSRGRSSSAVPQPVGQHASRASASPPRVRHAAADSSYAGAGCSPAIQAAAAAVDAASAAVAAALADAQLPVAAADAALGGTAAAATAAAVERTSLLLRQQQQLAEAADRWMSSRSSLHSPDMPADELTSCTAAGLASQQQHLLQRSVSPFGSPGRLLRARSLSPAGSSGAAAAAAAAAFGGTARPRSRSLSPLGRLQQRASSRSSMLHSSSSSPAYDVHRPCSPYAASAGVFQPPTAGLYPAAAEGARHSSCSYWAADGGGAASDGLYGHDTAALAAAAAAAEEDVAATAAAGSRCSSPAWRAAVAATYLSDLGLEQYMRFSRKMSQCSAWQQHFLAVQEAR
jgi:hypothetical protein